MAATFKSGSLSAHSKSGASTSAGLTRLPAHASAYTFYMWKRALLVKGGKDYGLAEQMFQEPEAREVKPSFDPSKQPQAPTSLDALEAASEDKLGPIEETISALKTEIKRHKSTLPDEALLLPTMLLFCLWRISWTLLPLPRKSSKKNLIGKSSSTLTEGPPTCWK